MSGTDDARAPSVLKPLFGELGDLKRIRSAGREGSIATRLFRTAWRELLSGRRPGAVATRITAAALAAARLGDIDRAVLTAAEVPPDAIASILRHAVEAAGADLPAALRAELVAAVAHQDGLSLSVDLPEFVAALEAQPRAGVTCPGRARVVLEPPESHAEHCLVVGVYGVLLARTYRADVGTVFLAGLSHHFHNAGMPDAGFTGECLLGEWLAPVMEHFTTEALATVPAPLRQEVVAARRCLADADTPEGRAFHAADVIDRVLQIAQHLRAATLTMDIVLDDMGLVHDGPVKPFHDRVLREMALP